MKKIIFLTALWLSSLTTIFILTFALALYSPAKSQVLGTEIYLGSHETETFSSVPQKVGQIESETQFEEAKNQIIRNYLIKYKAPEELLNEVDFIVEKSLEKEIDPRLVVAISRKESSFCKNLVKLEDGSSSNNCGGLGIYGKTVTSFSSIHDWVEAEINFLSKAYFSKGITDLCEIEKTHTPTSQGKWCQAVKIFIEEMN